MTLAQKLEKIFAEHGVLSVEFVRTPRIADIRVESKTGEGGAIEFNFVTGSMTDLIAEIRRYCGAVTL